MNEFLTQHFMTMNRTNNYQEMFSKSLSSITDSNVISYLDSNFSNQWAMQITDITDSRVAVALFLPGLILQGTGENETKALRYIITNLTNNIQDETQNNVSQINTSQTVQPTQKETVSSINQKLEQIKTNTENKTAQDNNAIFDSLIASANAMSQSKPQEQPQELPEELPFDSPESNAFEKKFWEDALKQPTPEMVNPTGTIYSNSWTPEVGMKLKAWSDEHGITSKEQMSSWLIRYCGLDYDHFNPEWTDKFLVWAKALRETQTY